MLEGGRVLHPSHLREVLLPTGGRGGETVPQSSQRQANLLRTEVQLDHQEAMIAQSKLTSDSRTPLYLSDIACIVTPHLYTFVHVYMCIL